MSNGLQKYVDDQYSAECAQNHYRMLQAYNRGVAAALAASELRASYSFPPPAMMPDGFKRMIGGGSDGYSVGPGAVDNSEYASLTVGGMEGGKKKHVNRLKKAKKWLDFTDDALSRGEKHVSEVKDIAGGKKKINRTKKAKKWLDFVDDALTKGEKHTSAVKDIAGGKKKINRTKKANKWLDFVDDALSRGESHASAVKDIAGGKKKINRTKKAKKWLNFVDDALTKGESHASAVKDIAGAGAGAGKKSPSAWIAHVKAYASEHGIPYKEAMSKAKDSYKK
jgi:L-rhamnose mutarotase